MADVYARYSTSDSGNVIGNAVPLAGLVPGVPVVIKVPLTAGAGTALDITVAVPQKMRLIDVVAYTTTTVTSAQVQVFTAASGGGSAASSALATAAAGVTRNALTTATLVFAAGSTMFVRQSGGATLSGGEVYLTCLPEV
jgi:hypothetical protein